MPTSEIARSIPGCDAAEAIRRTGVARRYQASDADSVVGLAARAVHKLLAALGGTCPPIGTLICSTTSPQEATPSVACQVSAELRDVLPRSESFCAFDVNAACSGFLFALNLAIPRVESDPEAAVLLVTSEVLSPMIDPSDSDTAFIFGDAATATLITGDPVATAWLHLARPLIKSAPDTDRALWSPNRGADGYLKMDGIRVARAANKAMADVLLGALANVGLTPECLGAIIPHPGSQRILESVGYRLGVDATRLLHTLADTGNTSSCSIPLAIDRRWDDIPSGGAVAMTAFGAGFTFAACLGQKCPAEPTFSALMEQHSIGRSDDGNRDVVDEIHCTPASLALEI